MSFGLGYMADGLLKGQERNRSWGLQQQQNQRANDANERAQNAEERAAGLYQYDLKKAQSDAVIAANNASPENLGYTNTTNAANAEYAGQRAVGAGLQNKQTQQQIELNAEELTPQAKHYRDKVRQYESEAMEWEHALRKSVHQNDQTKARLETSKLIDDRDYRALQLIRSGEHYGAAALINSFSDNPYREVVAVKQANNGSIVGYDKTGKASVLYTKEQVESLEQRVKSEVAKTQSGKAPKVYTEKKYNEMGAEVGERAYIVSQDPTTGQQYKQYIEERPENQITPQEEIQTAIDMVRNNELTPQQFKSWYGFDAPVTGNTAARPAVDDEFSDGDIARRPSSGFGLNQF